jgi:tRNA (guanine37-N1)-methyltransferase
MFAGPFKFSIIKRAIDKGLVELNLHDLREYSRNKYRSVDDYPFGGGAGMVMMIEPIAECINQLKNNRKYDEVIFLTPDGELLEQKITNELSLKGNLILLCGHYKGIDERIREHFITRELSIGDYVLSGGELAAAVLVDSIVRVIPGVLGDETSALSDSFQDGLLSPPVYTRPADFQGWKVPEVLISGHEAKIREWRLQQAIERTKKRRPGLMQEDQ